MAPILSIYPRGQLPTSDPTTDEFSHLGGIRVREDSALIRLDHRLSDRTNLYLRAIRDDSFAAAPLGNLFDTQQIRTKPQNYVVGMEHTFSPTIFNEFNSA